MTWFMKMSIAGAENQHALHRKASKSHNQVMTYSFVAARSVALQLTAQLHRARAPVIATSGILCDQNEEQQACAYLVAQELPQYYKKQSARELHRRDWHKEQPIPVNPATPLSNAMVRRAWDELPNDRRLHYDSCREACWWWGCGVMVYGKVSEVPGAAPNLMHLHNAS